MPYPKGTIVEVKGTPGAAIDPALIGKRGRVTEANPLHIPCLYQVEIEGCVYAFYENELTPLAIPKEPQA